MNKITSNERKQEIVDELRDVQSTFAEAWETLNSLVQELGDQHAQAYLVEQLQIMIFAEHGFVTRDMSIEAYADQVQDAMYEDPAPTFDDSFDDEVE